MQMNNTNKTAYQLLEDKFDFILSDEPMRRHTSFKIGGPADLFALPVDTARLKSLIKEAAMLNIPVSVFGSGTNLLVSDKGIRGLVIFTRSIRSGIRIIESHPDRVIVTADTGERLAGLCRFANEKGLSGIEFAAGIPGTIGGALAMNAGTPHGQISDIVRCLELLDPCTFDTRIKDRPSLDFGYRRLDTDMIILSAHFAFTPAVSQDVQGTYTRYLEKKQQTQPISTASAGCFFKNPENAPPAGKLIEDAGLKGKTINSAMVSDLHANYIVNTGDATCKDVMLLQELIQEQIFAKYGINLETEVRVEGEI